MRPFVAADKERKQLCIR